MCLNKNLFRGILAVILGFVLLPLILLGVPILVYRQILAKLGPCYVKKLGKILSPQGQYFFSVNPPETYNVLIWFKLSGKLHADLVKERFRTKCVFLRNELGGFVNPEFQQYPTMFGGYAFWKWEESFDMDKHFHYVTLDKQADAHAQFERMLQTPLPGKLSPWEATVLEFGDNSNCHFICFKFHHCMSDGEAIFDALLGLADSEPDRLQFPKERRASCFGFFRSIFYFISSYFNIIYNATDATAMILDGSNLTGLRRFPMSRSFDLGQAKQLRSKVNVSVSITMLGVLTGAIRRKLQTEGKSIPKQMRCLLTILTPNHPKKLTNKVMLLDMTLPVETASGRERLALLGDRVQKERIVKSSLVLYLLVLFNCCMPKCFMAPLLPINCVTTSIFPGPTKQFCIAGNPVEDLAYALHGGTHALIVNIASYNGKFRYWLGVDGKICSTEQNSKEFVQYLDDELHELIHLQ